MDEERLTRWLIGILRSRMAQEGLSYADLEQRLRAVGVEETERNLRNKVMRGTFSAAFWVQCLVALGERSVTFSPAMMGFAIERDDESAPFTKDELVAEIHTVMGSGED